MSRLQAEVDTGLADFKQAVERGGKLKVVDARPSINRSLVHLVIGRGPDKKTTLDLSYEFLSDLPAMNEYRASVSQFVSDLERRSEGPSLNEFYCRTGTPISVDIDWPLTMIANRDASFVHVRVRDLRNLKLIAKCSMILIHSPLEQRNPLSLGEIIVNRIRTGVDREEVIFYPEAAHPYNSQQVEIWSNQVQTSPASDSDLEQFVSGKTFWLAFKRGDQATKIWVADSWDARYLGVEQRALLQSAQIQQARGVLRVDSSGMASAGTALLLNKPIEPKRETLLFISADPASQASVRSVLDQLLPKSVSLLDTSTEVSVGTVMDSIRGQIERADFVLVDVTGNKPNVLLNLGYAQALRKKTAALIAKNALDSFPTDLAGFLYLPYDPKDRDDLKRTLGNYLQRYWGIDARV